MESVRKNGAPAQKTKKRNVYEQVQVRLDMVFKNFDIVYVSFSGGKDSSVLLFLCIEYLRKHYPGRKLGVFHMDYEVQYHETIRFVDKVLKENEDILEVYRVCVPFKVATCTSMYQRYWRPWDEEMKEHWVREMPEGAWVREDFPLPAAGRGEPVDREALDEMLRRLQPATFFDRGLCAHYFTYMKGPQAHFVLFDTPRSIREKLSLANRLGVAAALLPQPEIENHLEEIFGPGA